MRNRVLIALLGTPCAFVCICLLNVAAFTKKTEIYRLIPLSTNSSGVITEQAVKVPLGRSGFISEEDFNQIRHLLVRVVCRGHFFRSVRVWDTNNVAVFDKDELF